MKFDIKSFALTAGVFWGFGLFLITWWLIFLEGAGGDAGMIARLYPGYTITPVGSVVGLLWAFTDGLVSGAVFAWLYNVISACCKRQVQA